MAPVLFLDFDGVLHPSHFVLQNPFSNASVLENALTDHEVKIVITSSWRFTHSIEALRFDGIECFYNPKRRHSTIGYVSPMQFESMQYA